MMMSFSGSGNYGESFLSTRRRDPRQLRVHEDASSPRPSAAAHHVDFMNRLATSYLRRPTLLCTPASCCANSKSRR